MSRPSVLSLRWFPVVAVVSAAFVGCASTPDSADSTGMKPIAPGQGIDDFVLVDCLLPGQIRQLGTRMTYLAPRRMVKSTKSDCGIRGGEFVLFDRSDYASALATLRPKAESGDPVAQNYVGEIYEKGLGLPGPDPAMAASWYARAAEQGYSPAQTNLGSLYERGLGVPSDKAKALDLYRRASGLTEDRLIFESTLKAQRAAFQREIAVRNKLAAALRAKLKSASAGKPKATPKPNSAALDTERALRRQVESQRRDVQSEADRLRKELNAIKELKKTSATSGGTRDAGKTAQLGKLELSRNEEYRALLDTSRRLSQVEN